MAYRNRLSELRGDMSQAEFAEKLGLSQQNYWKYENEKQGMRSDLIEKVCLMFGCSAEWLLCIDDNGGPDDAGKSKGWVSVPLFGRIAAGQPIEMDDVDDFGMVPDVIHAKHPGSFLLRVDGESMNRVLPDGCLALVDPCDTVERNGKPYAICVNGYDATIKRVRRLENGFELVPDSTDPTFKPVVYDYGEPGTETITVIGEVVYYVLPFDWEF